MKYNGKNASLCEAGRSFLKLDNIMNLLIQISIHGLFMDVVQNFQTVFNYHFKGAEE